MSYALKVYPTAEELSSVCSQVRCPEENCTAVFQSGSNLNMHLIKHHKVDAKGLAKKEVPYEYYCPVKLCSYHKDSKKHFTKLKYLKQHYLKVHATKSFICGNCDKRFSTLAFRNFHVRSCGKLFTCTCGSTYNSTEAILTHCKRKGKGHTTMTADLPKKETITSLKEKSKITDTTLLSQKKGERFIYPKLSTDSFPIHYIAAIALSELSVPCDLSKVTDKGVQTDSVDSQTLKDNKKVVHYMKSERKRKNSQQTQTLPGKCKKIKISTETQTNSDYLKQKHKNPPKAALKKRKKSMETQTKDIIKWPEVGGNSQVDKLNNITQITTGNLNSKFGNEHILVNEIFDDSSSASSTDLKSLKLVQNSNQKDIKPIKQHLHNKDSNLQEDRTKKWIWENQSFAKTELISSAINQPSLITTVKNELFSMNHELNICSRELDSNLDDLNSSYSKRSSQLYSMDQGTDSQIFDINKLCNIETQTEIDTFLTECNDDTSFTLCSTTETQTTDDFDSLLYSNMCTQTCEEVDQLFNFNFVDIETQTAWPDLNDCSTLNS